MAVEQIIEVPVEQVEERMIGVERVNLQSTQKTVTKTIPVVRTVQVPVEYEVTKLVEQPFNVDIEKTVHRF